MECGGACGVVQWTVRGIRSFEGVSGVVCLFLGWGTRLLVHIVGVK